MANKGFGAPSAFSTHLLIAVAIISIALIAWRLSDLLVVVFGAVVIAVALRALAELLEQWLRLPERWSTSCAIAVVLAILTLVVWAVGNPLADQLDRVRERLPTATHALMAWIRDHRVGQFAMQVWEDAAQDGVPWARLAGFAGLTFGLLGNVVLMVVMGIYLSASPALYRRGLVRLLPIAYRSAVDGAMIESARGLRRWLFGQSISMAFVGTTTALGLWWLSIPLPFAVGLIAGTLAFIPFFGAIAGGFLAVLLAFMEGPRTALHVGMLCVVIQQIEGHVLMPLVQKWAIDLPPVLTLAAAVVFGALFGLVGVLFATPMMVVAQILIRKLYIDRILEQAPSRP
jgi:predicted PurR-regulated permease PerM